MLSLYSAQHSCQIRNMKYVNFLGANKIRGIGFHTEDIKHTYVGLYARTCCVSADTFVEIKKLLYTSTRWPTSISRILLHILHNAVYGRHIKYSLLAGTRSVWSSIARNIRAVCVHRVGPSVPGWTRHRMPSSRAAVCKPAGFGSQLSRWFFRVTSFLFGRGLHVSAVKWSTHVRRNATSKSTVYVCKVDRL